MDGVESIRGRTAQGQDSGRVLGNPGSRLLDQPAQIQASNRAAGAEQRGAVEVELELLEKGAVALGELLDQLESKLVRVLADEPEAKPGHGMSEPQAMPPSPFARSLLCVRDRLFVHSHRMRCLLRRLDL